MCLRAGFFFFFFNLGKQAALSAVVLYFFFFFPANDLLGKLNHLHSEKQPLLGGGVQVSGGGNTPHTHTAFKYRCGGTV